MEVSLSNTRERKKAQENYSNVHVITLEDVGTRVMPIPKMKAVVNKYDSNRREIGYKV